MKTIVFEFFNDRKEIISLRVNDSTMSSWDSKYHNILPQTLFVIELLIPENSSIYFKLWENNTAYLSYNKNSGKKIIDNDWEHA